MSFKLFEAKLVKFVNQNACLVVSQFHEKPYVCLSIGKEQHLLSNDDLCMVYLHPKKKDRFFVRFEAKVREFKSKQAEDIVNFVNLAFNQSLFKV